MAWTSPRTWTTSELVSASIMNTHVRDNLSVTAPGVAASGDAYKNACFATAANTVDFLPAPYYIFKDASGTEVDNTASEVTLASGSVSAGLLGTTGALRILHYGTADAPTSDRTFTYRVKFDSTTMCSVNNTVTSGANRAFFHTAVISNNDSASSQWCIDSSTSGTLLDNPTTGSFDTSSTFTVSLTLQFAGAYSDTIYKESFTTCELLI